MRAYKEVVFGFACYEELSREPSVGGFEVTARRIGLVGTEKEAIRWCAGDGSIKPRQPIPLEHL